MMLDALSNPVPADVTQKNGGRSGKSGDEASGFSGTLSKLSQDSGTGTGAAGRDGPDNQAEDPAVGTELDAGHDTRTRLPAYMMPHGRLDGVASGAKRISIAQAFPVGKDMATSALSEKKGKGADGNIPAEATDDVAADANATSGEEEAVPVGADLGASDLLSMLSDPSQQILAANAAGGRPAAGAEGRKADGQARVRDASATEAMRTRSDASEALDLPTAEIDPEQQQRVFRFVGGKDGSLNSELSQAANGRDRNTEGKTNATATENVTILDSRRYLGLAPNSNSAALVASMAGDADWSAAMQSSAVHSEPATGSSTGSVVHVLKLQMNPHDLGSVTATLRLIGEELHVHLTVETRAAYRQLSEDSSGMLEALKSQGFSVDQLTINIASTSDTDTQKGQQGAQNGQQMAGNGERNGGTPNREQSGTRFGAELNGDVDAAGQLGSSDAAAAGSGGSRAGQLYL